MMATTAASGAELRQKSVDMFLQNTPPLDSSTVAAAGRLPASDRQAMVDTMVDTLAGKLKADPGNVDGWVMLLRSRMVLDQKDLAAGDLAAARRALAGDRAKLAKLDAAARELRVPGS